MERERNGGNDAVDCREEKRIAIPTSDRGRFLAPSVILCPRNTKPSMSTCQRSGSANGMCKLCGGGRGRSKWFQGRTNDFADSIFLCHFFWQSDVETHGHTQDLEKEPQSSYVCRATCTHAWDCTRKSMFWARDSRILLGGHRSYLSTVSYLVVHTVLAVGWMIIQYQ